MAKKQSSNANKPNMLIVWLVLLAPFAIAAALGVLTAYTLNNSLYGLGVFGGLCGFILIGTALYIALQKPSDDEKRKSKTAKHKKHHKASNKTRLIYLVGIPIALVLCISTLTYAYNKFVDNTAKIAQTNSPPGGVVGVIGTGSKPMTSPTKIPSTSPPQPTQTKSSSSSVSSAPIYNPYGTTANPKDIYGCVLPPKNVSDVKLSVIDSELYAGCISIYKPSWCLSQANSATSAFSTTTLQAETIYDNAREQDEAIIQEGQHYVQQGGQGNITLGQQYISNGNSVLAEDQGTYRTAYDAAYNVYSNVILSSNRQGGCSNSIPTYTAPVY